MKTPGRQMKTRKNGLSNVDEWENLENNSLKIRKQWLFAHDFHSEEKWNQKRRRKENFKEEKSRERFLCFVWFFMFFFSYSIQISALSSHFQPDFHLISFDVGAKCADVLIWIICFREFFPLKNRGNSGFSCGWRRLVLGTEGNPFELERIRIVRRVNRMRPHLKIEQFGNSSAGIFKKFQ